MSAVLSDDTAVVLKDLCHLASGLLASPPSPEALAALRHSNALGDLASTAGGLSGAAALGLRRMQAVAAADGAAEHIADEFQRLFLGPGKLAAPPWESVYRSPDRLVMQEPAFQALRAYVDAGLGYEDMTRCPPDHLAHELGFVAALLTPELETPRGPDRAHAFFVEHIKTWVPEFCSDLEAASPDGFYGGLALMLRGLVALWPVGIPSDTQVRSGDQPTRLRVVV